MMTNNEEKALEALQIAYFDICDLLYGNTYRDLNYANKKEFLEATRDRLAEVENRLFPVSDDDYTTPKFEPAKEEL
jgi:hypothetical protein